MQQGSQGIVHQLLIEFWMTIVHAKKKKKKAECANQEVQSCISLIY